MPVTINVLLFRYKPLMTGSKSGWLYAINI